MVARSDVLVENFRPGVLGRMGLDPERLAQEYPDLVVASISGFGPIGPYRNRGGYDQVAQSMSGLMSLIGDPTTAPMRVGVPICDVLAGLTTAIGIAACVAGRARTGSGGYIQTSLIESTIGALTFQAQRYLSTAEVPGPQGNQHGSIAPYGVFQAANSPISIAAASIRQWEDLCLLVDRPALIADPRFRTPGIRHENRAALQCELNAVLVRRTAEEWTAVFSEAGIPCGPIYSIDQMFDDPQIKALGVTQVVQDSNAQRMTVLRGPIWIDGEPTAVTLAPPALGADTDAILSELGYTAEQIADLRDESVVGGEAASGTSDH
jgi:crotonobetainyl-CoA:carnitine CoA-transferase CaiB-like acyl-CoA transferase